MRPENDTIGQNEGAKRGLSFIGRARRAQIIEHAVEVIAENGYARASLAEIAKHAGISKGVISYHFASKEELMEQVVAETYTAGAHFIVPRIMEASSAAERLRVYIERNVEYIARNRKHMIALVEILINLRNKDGEPLFDAAADEAMLGSLELIFNEGQRSGEFRTFVPRVMAIAVRSAIDALPPRLIFDPSFDAATYGRELAAIFEHATRKGGS